MNRPRVCLALSISVSIMPVLTVNTMAAEVGNVQKKSSLSAKGKSKNQKIAESQSSIEAKSASPSAVLTIHPAFQSHDKPLIANRVTEAKHKNKPLLAELAPDQMLSQGNPDYVAATVIPPVVAGTVDLEELKTSNVIELKISQSRTFKLKNKIVRVSISDPSIAEPILVTENQLVLLGHASGGATLVLWDDAGNSATIDIRVTRDFSQLQAALREIDPRIIVKPIFAGGTDRVILLGDVDHPESVTRAFGSANVFMDDRGMNIQIANSRLITARIGEMMNMSGGGGGGMMGGGGGGGGGQGQLAQLSQVDRYTYFPNLPNNISKAQVITSDGGRVTSLIKVRKVPMIVLHCTFMEMNSIAARELGVQLGLAYTTKNFNFGIGGNNINNNNAGVSIINGIAPAFNQSALASGVPGPQVVSPVSFVSNSIVQSQFTGSALNGPPLSGLGQAVLNQTPASLLPTAVLLGQPGGASFSTGNLQNIFTSLSNINRGLGISSALSLNPTVQGLITRNRARILSEPTLVTISGERASFLAGGEIPIIESSAAAGATGQSVVFEPFGLRLNIIPVLMENGNVNLEVSPEERLISNVISFQPSSLSSSIPGFTTRKAQTIVEMKPGQELFIAGLITSNNGRDIIKTPVLGEVPVLGALYRSKAFNKNESELVVAIRPEIILPGTPGQLKLPEEISRVEGTRDTNFFQVEPSVIDERFYTSGRSERFQKTTPTLPEGSPIPDNE